MRTTLPSARSESATSTVDSLYLPLFSSNPAQRPASSTSAVQLQIRLSALVSELAAEEAATAAFHQQAALRDNLLALQNLGKREPHDYVDDFRAQWNHFNALAAVFTFSSTSASTTAGGSNPDQHKFYRPPPSPSSVVTQLAISFPNHTASLPTTISELILHHHAALPHDVRRVLLRSLILLRNRNTITSGLRDLAPDPLPSPHSHHLRRVSQQYPVHRFPRHDDGNSNSKNHSLNANASLAAQSHGARAQPKTKSEALWAVRSPAQL
ncbi:hypothetical protein CF319_g2018 [Tilletia indica]|nr:hypothetical protein CF319_g2018 [Tilletia indica]